MSTTPPFHLTALDLRGRRVLVVGAGHVATRRLERLLACDAVIDAVPPVATETVERLADEGRLRWFPREVEAEDIPGAWFVLAATDSASANALVVEAAEANHTFCVRSDLAAGGSARTPTHLPMDDFLVGVIGNRDPRGARALRDRIAAALGQADPA